MNEGTARVYRKFLFVGQPVWAESVLSFLNQSHGADRLGLTTLAAAGYDPEAQPDILAALAASQTLAARIGGRVPAASSDHPGYGTRIAEARQQAAANGLRPGQGQRGRDAYLAAIDGLTWGDGPTQGFFSGRTFLHPKLGFAFDPPAGWRLENHPDAVVALAALAYFLA